MDAIRPSSRLVPRKHCSAQGLGAFGSAGAGRGLATPLTRIWQKPHEPLPNANPTPFSRPAALASAMSPLDQHFLKQIAAGRGRGIRPPFPGGPPRIGAIGGIGAGPNDTAVFGFPFLSTVGGPISRYAHRRTDRCDSCRIRWLCLCTAVELDCTRPKRCNRTRNGCGLLCRRRHHLSGRCRCVTAGWTRRQDKIKKLMALVLSRNGV